MDRVLTSEISKSCFVYVDDVLIFGSSEVEHDRAFKRVFELLVGAVLRANRENLEYREK